MTTNVTITDTLYSNAKNGGGETLTQLNFAKINARNTWVKIRRAGGTATDFYYGVGSYVQKNYTLKSSRGDVDYYDQSVQLFRKLIISPSTGLWTLSNQRYYPSFTGANISGSNVRSTSYSAILTMVAYDTRTSDINLIYKNKSLTRSNADNIYTLNLQYEIKATRFRSLPRNLGTEDQIAAANAAQQSELQNTGGRSGRPSTSSRRPTAPAVAPPARFTPRPQPAPITVDFGPALQFGPSETELENKPYIMQRFVIPGQDGGLPQQVTRRFWLKIVPNSFQYSNVNAAWNEVDRPGNFPITDWAKYNLLKVSFKFLIASDVSSNRLIENSPASIPLDGLLSSVEPELREIRAIAGAPHPVSLVNFQNYLTNTMRFPFIQDKSGAKFVIADMSVTTSRFLPNGIQDASAAEVSITLTEYVEATTQLAKLPPIQSQTKPPTKPGDKPGSASNRGLFTDSWTVAR